MPRTSRVVIPCLAHHVTQRGARRMQTFFCDADYRSYIERVAQGCEAANVAVLAWCLMPNHVHLVLVPQRPDGLQRALKRAHQTYSWVVNRRQGWTGHLWQSRFQSFPMDDTHTLAAVRYVELNPVRARLVRDAEAWPWSSARAHCQSRSDQLILAKRPPPLDDIEDWREFLADGLDDATLQAIRSHEVNCKPLGSADFVAGLSRQAARDLTVRPRGRPPLKNRDRHINRAFERVLPQNVLRVPD